MPIPDPKILTSRVKMMPDMTYVQTSRALDLQQQGLDLQQQELQQRNEMFNQQQRQKQLDQSLAAANKLLEIDYSKAYLESDRKEISDALQNAEVKVTDILSKKGKLDRDDRIWLGEESAKIKNMVSMAEQSSSLYAKNMLMAGANKDLDIGKFDDLATQQSFVGGWGNVKDKGLKSRFDFLSTWGPVRKSPDWNPLEFFGSGKGQVPVKTRYREIGEKQSEEVYDPIETKKDVLISLETPYGQSWKTSYEKFTGVKSTNDQFADYMVRIGETQWRTKRSGPMVVNVNTGQPTDFPVPPPNAPASASTITLSNYRMKINGIPAPEQKDYKIEMIHAATLPEKSATFTRGDEDFNELGTNPSEQYKDSPARIGGIFYVPRDKDGNFVQKGEVRPEFGAIQYVPYIKVFEKVDPNKIDITKPISILSGKKGAKEIATYIRLTPENLKRLGEALTTPGGETKKYWEGMNYRYYDKGEKGWKIVGGGRKTKVEKEELDNFLNDPRFYDVITSGRFQIIR